MLGVPIDGSVLMLEDNKSVVMNTTIPSSALKKKHCAVAYHRVREAVAARIVRFCHIDTRLNIADILTKPLAHEGRAWIKAKRIRNKRNLRNAEHWIPADVFGKKEPASLAFYIFENSLFLVDPAWEIGNDFFNWMSVEPLSQKDPRPRRRIPRRQKQIKKPRKYIDI